MTGPLSRRLDRIEDAQLRPMRKLVIRIVEHLGGSFSLEEIEDIARRHVGTPALVRRLRDAGLSREEILERLGERGDHDQVSAANNPT